MIQTTTWHPDTCACVIQYQWDSDIPEDQRDHEVHNILSTCPDHQGTPEETFTQALELNQAFNEALAQDENS